MTVDWGRVWAGAYLLLVVVILVAMFVAYGGCAATPTQTGGLGQDHQQQQLGVLNAYAEKLDSLLEAIVEANVAVGGVVSQMGDNTQNFDAWTMRILAGAVGVPLALFVVSQGVSIWYLRGRRSDAMRLLNGGRHSEPP